MKEAKESRVVKSVQGVEKYPPLNRKTLPTFTSARGPGRGGPKKNLKGMVQV